MGREGSGAEMRVERGLGSDLGWGEGLERDQNVTMK